MKTTQRNVVFDRAEPPIGKDKCFHVQLAMWPKLVAQVSAQPTQLILPIINIYTHTSIHTSYIVHKGTGHCNIYICSWVNLLTNNYSVKTTYLRRSKLNTLVSFVLVKKKEIFLKKKFFNIMITIKLLLLLSIIPSKSFVDALSKRKWALCTICSIIITIFTVRI